MRLLRLAAMLTLVLWGGCSTSKVVRIPVSPDMEERENPPPTQVRNVRLGFIRPVVFNNPSKRVDLTNSFAESYATQTHQAHAVPQALREAGFSVVELVDESEAAALNLDWVITLGTPEVDAVHPAQGDRVTLVGSAYDVRVHYRGVVRSGDGKLLGLVAGFGQETNRFIFMEPLFREATVGMFVSLATFGASIFTLGLVLQLGLLANLVGRGDVFGLCGEDRSRNYEGPALRRTPPVPNNPFFSRQDLCVESVNYMIYGAFVAAVGMFTSVMGSLAGAVGGNVTDVVVAALHLARVDPAWRGMVQGAHDEAARDLADDLARRILDAPLAPARRHLLPPPAPADLPAMDPQAPMRTAPAAPPAPQPSQGSPPASAPPGGWWVPPDPAPAAPAPGTP
jgi:hypothetical protein